MTPTIPDTLLISLIGFATVFAVLVVLMFIIQAISVMVSDKKTKAEAPVKTEQTKPVQEEKVDAYTGVKLINVSDKDAAIIMAIVADKLDKPLDNLRFISIKEVK